MRSERMVAIQTGKNDDSLEAPWLVPAHLSGITPGKPVLIAQTQLKQSGN